MIGSGWEDTDFFSQLKHRFPNGKIVIYNNGKVVHLNEEKENSKWNEYNRQVFEEREEERKKK